MVVARGAFVCLLAAALAGGRGSSEVRLVWKLNIADAGPPHDVQALRFSWDGKWIAAVAPHLRTTNTPANDLLIVPVTGEVAGVQRFTIEQELLSTPLHVGIHWSPSGDYLAAETKHFSAILLRLADGARCELPRTTVFGGFVGQDRVIAADWELPSDPAFIPATTSTLTIYDTACRRVRSWRIQGQVRDIESYAPAGVMALNVEQSGVRVVAVDGGDAVGRLPESIGSMLRFGEKGRVLCRASPPGGGFLACWDFRSGERMAHPEVEGGAPMDVSGERSVVVATNSAYSLSPFEVTGRRGLLGWVIWDYRTGRELARLGYKKARHGYAFSPAAVSPDGRHVAIGGGDVLHLYEISRE
jgi:hypothetical protein